MPRTTTAASFRQSGVSDEEMPYALTVDDHIIKALEQASIYPLSDSAITLIHGRVTRMIADWRQVAASLRQKGITLYKKEKPMEDRIEYPLECSPTDAIAPGPEGASLPLYYGVTNPCGVGVAQDPDVTGKDY